MERQLSLNIMAAEAAVGTAAVVAVGMAEAAVGMAEAAVGTGAMVAGMVAAELARGGMATSGGTTANRSER